MTKVMIRAYSTIQRLLSPKPFEIETPAKNILGLIEYISEHFNPKIGEELLAKEGGLNPKYQIFVNGENIKYKAGFSTPIYDEDIVLISTVIDGG